MDDRLVKVTCIALALASIASSVYGRTYASIGMVFTAMAVYAASRRNRHGVDAEEKEAAAFMRAVSMDPQSDRCIMRAVDKLSYCAAGLGRKLRSGLRRYWLSGDAEASFSRGWDGGSRLSAATLSIISGAIVTGNGIYNPIREMWESSKTRMSGVERKAAARTGSALVSAMGTALFFPAFAGICTGILMFSGLQGGAAAPDIAPILLFYIAASNAVNFKYSERHPWKAIEKALMAVAAGFAVFGLTLMFSRIMLG
jgi:hypothetical protein